MSLDLQRHIPRSRHEIWQIATDWQIAEFWLGLEKVRPMHPKEPLRKGSRLLYRVKGTDHTLIVTEWKAPERLAFESTLGGVTAHYQYRLRREEGGTHIQLKAHCTAEGWFWKLLLPLASKMMLRADRAQLDALAKLVVATTGGPQAESLSR